jgi:hypothetical protein
MPRFAASEVYGGRGFREAATAADLLDARLMIASAGLGLIDAESQIPPYSCTVLTDAPDSIMSILAGDVTTKEWWQILRSASPFSLSLQEAAGASSGPVLVGLSEAYVEMVSEELLALAPEDCARLRILTRAPASRIAPQLRPFILPYDDRLDGPDSPVRGTRSDFASRASRHFAQYVAGNSDDASIQEHCESVAEALRTWRYPDRAERSRHDDATLRGLIADHWQAAGGSATRLLRVLRDDLNVACEQGRFAGLVRDVRATMP